MPRPKFLLDADMPKSSAEMLRSLGYDVEDVRDIGMRAAKDREIILYAYKTNRIILTKDSDFGEVLRYPRHPGSIIFRLPSFFTSQKLNSVLKDFFSSVDESELREAIIIVEPGRYRRRPVRNP